MLRISHGNHNEKIYQHKESNKIDCVGQESPKDFAKFEAEKNRAIKNLFKSQEHEILGMHVADLYQPSQCFRKQCNHWTFMVQV